MVELGEQMILSKLHFFQRKYSPELAGLPAELEHERVRGCEEYQGPPQAHLDSRPAHVQQVPNNIDLLIYNRYPITTGTFMYNRYPIRGGGLPLQKRSFF